MSASRLLSTLLMLQTRGRMTVGEIAEKLEVSTRTVRRDVDALSSAGVPVYTERGRRGGVVLLPGARIDVSRLDPPEVDALAVGGVDREQRRQLGISDAYDMAARKIDARRTADARTLRDVVLVDNTGWFSSDDPGPRVSDLALDLVRGRRLSLSYRRSGAAAARTRLVDPYGLVAKAGRWYLVGDVEGEPVLFLLARIRSWNVEDDAVRLREGRSLESEWNALKQSTERGGTVEVTARLHTTGLDLAKRILGSRLVSTAPLDDEWSTIILAYTEIQGVRQLLQFGDHIEVVEPPEARRIVRELAADLAARHV